MIRHSLSYQTVHSGIRSFPQLEMLCKCLTHLQQPMSNVQMFIMLVQSYIFVHIPIALEMDTIFIHAMRVLLSKTYMHFFTEPFLVRIVIVKAPSYKTVYKSFLAVYNSPAQNIPTCSFYRVLHSILPALNHVIAVFDTCWLAANTACIHAR